jgi:hypothetical protein
MFRLVLATLLLVPPLLPQITPERALVATAQPGGAMTTLLEVDLATGATSTVGQVALDPLAVTIDPINLDVILANDEGSGTSGVWRIALSGTTITSQRQIASVSGRIRDLAVGSDGFVLAAATGAFADAVWAIPRNGTGGVPFTVVQVARPVSLSAVAPGSSFFTVITSGTPGPPPVLPNQLFLDVYGGLTMQTPLTSTVPLEVTSGLELLTAVPRDLLAHPDGTVTLWENGTASNLPLTPTLGAGATQVLTVDFLNFIPLVLGNQNSPFLRTFDIFNPTTWTTLAGPLPGNPVDVTIAPRGGSQIIPMDAPCGLSTFVVSDPRINNPAFALGVSNALPATAAYLALGQSDQFAFGSIPLPVPVLGGCSWWVRPDFIFPALTSGTGSATILLPVPNDPALVGTIFFAQWIQLQAPGMYETSEPLALHVGQ